MVDVITYKATKVYTPQTNEWAEKAALAQDIGRAAAGITKAAGKIAEGAEKKDLAQKKEVAKFNSEIAKENKKQLQALESQRKTAYDKMMDAQADDLAQRFQIELARQTGVINQQFKLDPLNPEKENQTRAVAKDLQAQWLEKIPQASRERFIEKTNSKTNEYILTDVKSAVKEQLKQSDQMMGDNIKFAVKDAERLAGMGDFDAVQKNFVQSRSELEQYLTGIMSPEEKDIAERQFDRSYVSALIKGVAVQNPQLARELKDNPAAVAAILSGGDYVGELAVRAELNKGTEQIAGMEFPKNARYQKEKEQAKLVNSLGLVELDYDNGGKKGLTLASSSADPQLTRYTAELLGGGVSEDLDVAIKQAENVQKAQLDKARYDGAVQSVFTASYQNLDQLKDSDLYKKGDEYTVGFAQRYEQMLNDRRDALNNAVQISDEELSKAISDYTKSLEKIDGADINPVVDAYTKLSKIQAAVSANPKLSRLNSVKKFIGNIPGAEIYADMIPSTSDLQKSFEEAVKNQNFRSDITTTISKHWVPQISPTWFSIKPKEQNNKLRELATSNQELATLRAENEAVAGFLALAGQGRIDDAKNYYLSKRNAYYDSIYSNIIDMDSVYASLAEGKKPIININGGMCYVEGRDTDGQLLFEPLMTKVAY